jgi:subtilase family serine protease
LHYHVIIAGESYHVSGTSASSPVVAAMITLVNAARLRAGKGPVGWLNPALYAFWRNFTMDVVHGDNKCGANNIVCCQHGFNAAPGWDAATGLGTLNHTSLMRVLVGLGGLTTSGAGAGGLGAGSGASAGSGRANHSCAQRAHCMIRPSPIMLSGTL